LPTSVKTAVDLEMAAALLEPLTTVAREAGAAILSVNRQGLKVDGKADGSPVTEADHAADRIIADGLKLIAPEIAAVSEERACDAASPAPRSFFLIDPLDGTKEFLSGRDEFTVNIALVVDGTPLLGIIGAPALGLIWRGVVGRGAQRLVVTAGAATAQSIFTRKMPASGEPWIAAVSRSHSDARTKAFIDSRRGAMRLQLGSAVKLGRVAEGAVDIYPRLAPTSEWDIAAGHAIVTAAGGLVTDSKGDPLRFGAGGKDFIVPEFIAWGDPSAASGGQAS
jgi:3'(2'), 5'-bisphosphate nucleotidase